jgi:hypothetical protein
VRLLAEQGSGLHGAHRVCLARFDASVGGTLLPCVCGQGRRPERLLQCDWRQRLDDEFDDAGDMPIVRRDRCGLGVQVVTFRRRVLAEQPRQTGKRKKANELPSWYEVLPPCSRPVQ